MPPPLLLDLNQIDLNQVLLTQDQVYQHLPHAYEFRLLGGVCHIDLERLHIVGFADLRADDWWCRGHVPGRPLLPGVLMVEMGAQLSAVLAHVRTGNREFIGFGGIEKCKFREPVFPPARLYILAVGQDHRSRRIVSTTQGVSGGHLIFEATVIGLTMNRSPG